MAEVLFMLGEYYDNDKYKRRSESMLIKMGHNVATGGPYYARWASLQGIMTFKPFQVAVVGEDALKKSSAMQKKYLPTAIFMGGAEENLPLLENKSVAKRTIIYVCRDRVCKFPEEFPAKALKLLASQNQFDPL
jgi:uncharacterized protein YyaL (SSP411 family)